MDYRTWNDSIAREFFNVQSAQRPIYLYVTDELLERIGRAEGVGKGDFVRAVKGGPDWVTDGRLSLCGKAKRACSEWRAGRGPAGIEYPPYIAYLALFVLAAGVEGGFAQHAYYPRLHQLLGEDENAGMPPVFDEMWGLWFDLEDWSKSDKNGDLGVLNINFSGSWQNVGLPIGQTLLSEEDRHKLIPFFAADALDPSSPPTEREMLALLREKARGLLQRRTQRILDAGGDAELRDALVLAALSELQHWDGQLADTSGEEHTATSVGTLWLCCRLDATAASAHFRIRIRSTSEFPDEQLSLEGTALISPATCDEAELGWSTELVTSETGTPIDASLLNWSMPIELEDKRLRWRAVMPASPFHLFVLGAQFGLPHFVETARLTRSREFLILARDRFTEISDWGRNHCENFRSVTLESGLRQGWQLFHSDGASDDAGIRDIVPRFALPSSLRIGLKGGVRTQEGAASRYLAFAPPAIQVDSPDPGVVVTCNGTALQQRQTGAAVYALPAATPVDTLLKIEAKEQGGNEAHVALTLVAGIVSRWQEQQVRFDSFGERTLDAVSMRGAQVHDAECSPFNFGAALPPISAAKAYLVGKTPGEISCWPSDPLPAWQPIWAVVMRGRKGTVVPCMEDCETAAPGPGAIGRSRQTKNWKEVVWHWRKRVVPPEPPYAALWERYKEAAKDV